MSPSYRTSLWQRTGLGRQRQIALPTRRKSTCRRITSIGFAAAMFTSVSRCSTGVQRCPALWTCLHGLNNPNGIRYCVGVAVSMSELTADLRAESDDLLRLLAPLTGAEWESPTPGRGLGRA